MHCTTVIDDSKQFQVKKREYGSKVRNKLEIKKYGNKLKNGNNIKMKLKDSKTFAIPILTASGL